MRDTADADGEKLEQDDSSDIPAAHTASISRFQDMSPSVLFTVAQQDLAAKNKKLTTVLKSSDGKLTTIPLHDRFKASYRDAYTDELLPRERVETAIHDELS